MISGNIFAGLQEQAILATAKCQGLVITGNLMADLNRSGRAKRPALDLENPQQSLIEHNVVERAEPAPE